ncbi:MAG: hypothetical protein KDJ22_15795 [Candidatus Competibacteraceae bacterium]|nr:hypothetical protein [Candidatus Competibacteraceae bacterium]HRX71553.1 hypothetical protein [Candidatus Competibacteraceae bacterium]
MNPPGLSYDQAPPFSVPLRFFLTAPWFLFLAAAVLLWEGPGILASRWLPATLALTHLIVLGFMAQVMLGALAQILPVVVGVSIAYPRWIAMLIHVPLTLGTLALASAFLGGGPVGFQIAAGLLGFSFSAALITFHRALWRAPVVTDTVIALRCALGALLVTVALGLLLSGYLGWGGFSLPILQVTNLHAIWGLVGWTALLVAGVAYQVVPMFQITPLYPAWLSRGFAPVVTAMLIVGTVLTLNSWPLAATVAGAVLAVTLIAFAVRTLLLLYQRRRKIGDPTLIYWRISMISLATGAAGWLLTRWMPEGANAPAIELLLGILLIVGFPVVVINGMLYKIVPFLAWFHLQAHLLGRAKPPHIKQLLPETPIRRQGWTLLITLLLLLAAVLYPLFLYPAALALGMTGGWLGVNLWRVAQRYRQALASTLLDR